MILGLAAAFYGWRADRARNEADQATEQAQAARGRAVSAETKSRSLNLAREAERVINAVKQGSTELAYLQSLAALRLHDSDAGLSAVLSGLTSSPHAYRMVRLGFEPTPALAYSPVDGKLALGGNDGVLHLLDAATGRAAGPPMGGHKGAIWSVAFSGDGRRLVASAIDDGGDTLPRPDPADVGELHLWDLRTHRLLRRLRGHLGDVYSVAYSKRSEIIASGGADGSLRVWDPATGSLLWMKDKGDLNGPVIGAIFTIVGFAAYGKHPRNIVPIMLGVFIASMLKDWSADDPSAVLAALFGTTLAPIAGRFGWRWGIVAGFVHSSVAQTVGQLHGGLVLYNNGFAAGLVAAILVPVIIALQPAATTDPGAPQ